MDFIGKEGIQVLVNIPVVHRLWSVQDPGLSSAARGLSRSATCEVLVPSLGNLCPLYYKTDS